MCFIIPPYSPNLVPAHYFLSCKLKLKSKENRFDDVKQIQSNVTRQLNSVPVSDFQNVLYKLGKRAKFCVELEEIYIEK